MRTLTLSIPQLGMVVGTRAMLAAGIALLAASRMDRGQRRAVGTTLVAVGALTTIPLALEILGALREQHEEFELMHEPHVHPMHEERGRPLGARL